MQQLTQFLHRKFEALASLGFRQEILLKGLKFHGADLGVKWVILQLEAAREVIVVLATELEAVF